jgi:hypothetical protein
LRAAFRRGVYERDVFQTEVGTVYTERGPRGRGRIHIVVVAVLDLGLHAILATHSNERFV